MTIFSSVDDPEHYMKCPPWAFCADTTIARMFKGVTTLSQLRNLRYNQDDDGPRHYYLGRGRVVYRPCDVAEWLHPEISAEEYCNLWLRETGREDQVHPDGRPGIEAWWRDPVGVRQPSYLRGLELGWGLPNYRTDVSLTSRRRKRARVL